MQQRERIWAKSIFTAEKLSLRVSRHELNGSHVVPHDHDFMEAVVITGGEGLHYSIHGHQPLVAGDVIILRPGAWHAYRECRRLALYNCCFGVELLQRELACVFQDPALNYLFLSGPRALDRQGLMTLHLPPTQLRASRRHLDVIAAGHVARETHTYIEQIGHLILFLGGLGRALGREHRKALETETPLHPAVQEGVRLLEDRHAEPWTLPLLAARLHLDRSYLVRVFKAGTGLSPMHYLARHRAEQAAGLLLRTERPIAEIGEAVGWPDPNYFARRFKACFGVSASEYRARFIEPVTTTTTRRPAPCARNAR